MKQFSLGNDNHHKICLHIFVVASLYRVKLNLLDKQIVRWHKKCLCLVEFDCVEKIVPPLEFEHQGNMDDWLIIDKIEDVVVGSSIPYNYEKSRF